MWLIAEHPGVTDRINNTFIELRCQANPYYGLSVSLAYNFLLLIGCIYLAIHTQKVPADYNETRFIHITVFSIMCVIRLAFLPMYYSTMSLHPVIYISRQIVAIFMTATCLVVFLIVPKLYLLFVKKEREEYTTTQYISSTVGSSLCAKQNCPCACKHPDKVPMNM